ncbi:GLPGLI family protein [Chryseobacterium sp. KBW03]|uniref:GLPGLI family protein n=1 Tax=Chryseobacterium sp. KBW03 TaxID=2153362 RepID=UPI000F5B11EB|nr:GLPGLI family protein [Chryseobacterium sp. KBW03]RQO38111.1 GLPGLI family protein [Chryseobacterium sp. KBW03]
MKNHIKNSFLLMLLSFFFANSQTHRFVYDVEYKKDSTSNLTTKENYLLDINKSEVLYYTRDFFIADSLINNNIPFPKNMKLNTSTIITHRIGDNNYHEYDLLENTILKLQTKDFQNWKLTGEKKKIKELFLQKAVTNWGGRNWTAWFTTEIPFQEGPYKFHGLPGLIVELYDDKDNYRFELVKSEKYNGKKENQFIEISKQQAVAVEWEKYKSTKIKFYESPVNFIQNSVGDYKNEEFFLNNGTKVNSLNTREINESLRRNIKKYNNPVELNRAIVYPN